jgi:hypothetical protein
MTLMLQLPPEVEAKLSKQAMLTGRTLEAFVLEALEEKLSGASEADESIPAGSRLDEFREWFASHPSSNAVVLDDSRESIYGGRGQ